MAEETQQQPETGQQLTDLELAQLAQYLSASGAAPVPDEKYNTHVFLHRVATADDTTKVGNLSDVEVGKPEYAARALKQMALVASDIIDNDELSKFFLKESEILTATSLSKEGFLVRQATTTTRQIADVTKKPKAENKSWFKKKDNTAGGETNNEV